MLALVNLISSSYSSDIMAVSYLIEIIGNDLYWDLKIILAVKKKINSKKHQEEYKREISFLHDEQR
jgi:hypothetical protein